VSSGRPLACRQRSAEESQGPGVKPFTPDPSGPSGRDPLATVTVTVQRPVELSVVEQRYHAILAVERGEPKIVVAAQFEISRQPCIPG
jgi:hypothetical protein